jgi:hypothetical protein
VAELGCCGGERAGDVSERDERDEREGGIQVPSGGRIGLRRQARGGEAIGPTQDTQELAS